MGVRFAMVHIQGRLKITSVAGLACADSGKCADAELAGAALSTGDSRMDSRTRSHKVSRAEADNNHGWLKYTVVQTVAARNTRVAIETSEPVIICMCAFRPGYCSWMEKKWTFPSDSQCS